MNIGVDLRSLLSPTGRGVSHYTQAILAELIRQHPDDQWHLLQTGRRPYARPEELQAKHVHLHHYRHSNKLLNLRLVATRRPRLDHILPPVDVFFMPNLGFVSLGRTPLVVTVHDLSFELFPKLYSPGERLWHRLVRPRQLLERANRVISVSDQTKQELERLYGLDQAKVRTIHSGIDQAFLKPVSQKARQAVRRKYQLPEGYLLFVGSHDPRKRLPDILEAFRKARARGLRADLVLAGSGSPALQRLVRQAGIPAVRTLGYLPEADKPGLYAEASACLLVSSHEGFGFPPLEALAVGTPAVVSDLPVFRETLGTAAITVPLGDTEALAEKLVHLGQARRQRPDRTAVRSLTWRRAAEATYRELARAAETSPQP